VAGGAGGADGVILASALEDGRDQLLSSLAARFGPVPVLDAAACFGEALAALPALAWVAALDLLVAGACRRVVVLSRGADRDLGVVALTAGGPGS
jgi:hypothetical protein